MKLSVLAIFPQAPWPVRQDGMSIRFYPLLQELSAECDVDLLVLTPSRAALPDDPLIRKLRRVEVLHHPRIPRPPGLKGLLMTAQMLLPWTPPGRFSRYNANVLRVRLREHLAGKRYDVVWWIGGDYAEVVKDVRALSGNARMVMDLVDSPYLGYSRSFASAGLLRRYDIWKSRRWEYSLRTLADETIYISEPDSEAALPSGARQNTHVIPNGVYTADIDPAATHADIEMGPGPCIGFLGNMGYPPNIEAALTCHREFLAPLHEQFPELQLMIIGRDPVPRVQSLAGPNVIITGYVESIWPYIAAVDIFVFPLTTGSGLQNKVLEAMFAGKPVVTTDLCRAGLGGRDEVPVLTGRTMEEMRVKLAELLANPLRASALGAAGRDFVVRTFDWSVISRRYRDLLLRRGAESTPE